MEKPSTWADLTRARRPLSSYGDAQRGPTAAIVSSGAPQTLSATYGSPQGVSSPLAGLNDGVQDASDALQALVDALPAPRLTGGVYVGGGGVLTLPAGTYRLSRPLRLPHNVTLRGAGAAPNNTENQGATLLDAEGLNYAVVAEGVTGVGVEELAIKSASVAAIRLNAVSRGRVRRVSVFGGGTGRIGVWIGGESLFCLVEDCNISGLVEGWALRVEEGSNEARIVGGNLRQSGVGVSIRDCNGVLVEGVNMEGGAAGVGLEVLGAEVTALRCRFEGLGCGVRLARGESGDPAYTGLSNSYHPDTAIGLDDTCGTGERAILEPMIYRCPTPFAGVGAARLAPLSMTDPGRAGLKMGALSFGDLPEGGANRLMAGSGRLVLEMAGGNPLELRVPAGSLQWLQYAEVPDAVDHPLRALLDAAPLGSLYSRLHGRHDRARLWVKVAEGAWLPADGELEGPINPRHPQFGARGDGQTDDGPALQAAFDALAARQASGQTARLLLPRGVYRVRQPLVLRGAGGPFELRGEPGALIQYDGPIGAALCTIDGAQRYRVEGIDLSGAGLARSAVELVGNGGEGAFVDCRFTGVQADAAAAAFAVHAPEGHTGYQQDLGFERCTFAAGNAVGAGLRVRHTQAARLRLDGCRFEGNGDGISLVHNLGVSVRDCVFQSGADFALRAHDSQLVVQACTFYTGRVLWLSMGSAAMISCAWVPGALPPDNQFVWVSGRLTLLGCDFLNQNFVGAPRQVIGLAEPGTVFSRGSRFTDCLALPVHYWGERIGGPEGTEPTFVARETWSYGRGPAIDSAGDISVSYSGPWLALPSVVEPAPHLIGAALPVGLGQSDAGVRVLSEGQLSRQVARFVVSFTSFTAAASTQTLTLARPFHRTRVVGALIEVRAAFAGVGAPRVSLGIGEEAERLLLPSAADAPGLVGDAAGELGAGLAPGQAVQGGCLVGWTDGQQARLTLSLTADGALGDGAQTLFSAGELEVVVVFEVL